MIFLKRLFFTGCLISSMVTGMQAASVLGYKEEILMISDFIETLERNDACCFFQAQATKKVKTFLSDVVKNSDNYTSYDVAFELFIIELGRIISKSYMSKKDTVKKLYETIKSYEFQKVKFQRMAILTTAGICASSCLLLCAMFAYAHTTV